MEETGRSLLEAGGTLPFPPSLTLNPTAMSAHALCVLGCRTGQGPRQPCQYAGPSHCSIRKGFFLGSPGLYLPRNPLIHWVIYIFLSVVWVP